MSGKLTALQVRVVEVLAGLEPAWTLSGGGALAGVHLKHRRTRDLDLFWHGREALGRVPDEVERLLTDAGLHLAPVQRTPGFSRFTVTNREEQIVLDLIAEPVPYQEAPVRARIGRVEIWIDTPHEVLVNKLCSLEVFEDSSTWGRRRWLVCALLLGVAAVGCDHGLDPEPQEVGRYALVSVDRRELPAVFILGETTELAVLADTVRLIEGGRWRGAARRLGAGKPIVRRSAPLSCCSAGFQGACS